MALRRFDVLPLVPLFCDIIPPMRKRHIFVVVAVLVYAVAGIVATPKIRHAWWYLQENASRRFSTFCGLSAASVAFPWCLPSGLEAYRNICARGVPPRVNPVVFAMALGTDVGDVETIDARVMNVARFKAILETFRRRHGGYRLWCFGRFDYCLTPPCRVDFGKVLDRFSDEKTFATFAESRLYSPAALFACYVGDAAAVDPAFAAYPAYGPVRGALTAPRVLFQPPPEGALAPVAVARMTPFDVKFPDWIVRGTADASMFLDFEDGYETAQEARRETLIGFDYAAKGMTTNALACWAKAAKANPRDPVLMELADALDFEARSYLAIGNVNGALRCYEHRIEVFPTDVAAIHNFGVCLKRAGHPEQAAQVFARAVELDPQQEAHRLELIDSADAGGLPEVAVQQIDELLKRRPDDPELKKRRVRILVQKQLQEWRRRTEGVPDHSPSRYLDATKKGQRK